MMPPKTPSPFRLLNLLWAPAFTLLTSHSFFGNAFFSDFLLSSSASAIALPVMFLLSQIQIKLSLLLRTRYPRFEQRKTRFAAWIFVSLPITLIFIFFLWVLFSFLPSFGQRLVMHGLVWALVLGTIAHFIAIIVNEGQFTYHQWKNAIADAERLQKINWESRYEGLKQQVNPHFLFNSINALSSLIHEDKTAAGRYVKEMSQVYRYLLRNNDDELVPLKKELDFIQSYYHLLKTRFGSGITLIVDVPQTHLTCLLPPLSLQMLVENAVKHNKVSKDAPLTILITCTKDGHLLVKNNLQRKQSRVDSTGIGLNNIREKYRLLGLPEVQLAADEQQFNVMLPLVEHIARR